MTYMPNTIFSCQTTFKNTKFLEFGLKNANLATLLASRPCFQTAHWLLLSNSATVHRLHVMHARFFHWKQSLKIDTVS